MATAALVVLALAAVGGLFLAARHLRGGELPWPVTILHGLLAATGLVLLALVYFAGGEGAAVGPALLILVVAALGGFFLVSFHLRGQRAPKAVVVVHALFAVGGFLTLLVTVLGGAGA